MDLIFEIDLNSRKFENFDFIQSLIKMIRVQKCVKDLGCYSPHRRPLHNLITAIHHVGCGQD
jgi:hypothetical protein